MMLLVIGGSGSGKSSYAEEAALALSEGEKQEFFPTENRKEKMNRYYLATMQVFDEEGRQKVERHRKLRNGKGFLTIEQPRAIQEAVFKMEAGAKTILLECISNLAANEMFCKNPPKEEKTVVDIIVSGVACLKENAAHLVVVTNNVFEDGVLYDDATMAYLRMMGTVNQKLAVMADRVIEVVAGIPVVVK